MGIYKIYKAGLYLIAFFIVLMVSIYILFGVVFMISDIPSASMEGTIMTGDKVLSTRYDADAENLKRYDIVIFNRPDVPSEIYIKRLVGLPGETIVVKDGEVYADGVKLDNSFINEPQSRRGDGTYIVPEGCYFFLGDNRNYSKDSRFWKEKYVPAENILARSRFVIRSSSKTCIFCPLTLE